MKTFIILGMHRSATSLVAKALNNEIHMGANLMPPKLDNPEGFFENMEFVKMNMKILRLAGGSWDNPPPEKKIISIGISLSDEIIDLIQQTSGNGQLWGWKDPRTSLTIRAYHPHLINPHYITCYRSPDEIAKSLQKRNGFSIEKGLALTWEYNRRIASFISEFVENCGPSPDEQLFGT